MKSKPNSALRFIGVILYITGILAGSALVALSAWGDIEASTFDAALQTDETLRSLECPVFIGKEENSVIAAEIDNTTERDVSPVVRARITQGYVTLVREHRGKVEIPQGESARIEWDITAEDAAYRQLILARVYQFSNYSLPSRQSTCGVVVVPIPGLTGQQFYILLFVSALVLSAVGLFLWIPNRGKNEDLGGRKLRAYIYLAAYLLVASLLNLWGNWLLSVGLVVLAFLSLIAVASFALLEN